MGDDDLAGNAFRLHVSLRIDDFHDNILGSDVHAAARAFVGNEARVAATVAVGNRASKSRRNRLALMIVQTLGGAEHDLDAQRIKRNAVLARNRTLLAEDFGVTCLHPEKRDLVVDVGYSERGRTAELGTELSAALRKEGESFMRSLKFKVR